jgi:hypothetical protein
LQASGNVKSAKLFVRKELLHRLQPNNEMTVNGKNFDRVLQGSEHDVEMLWYVQARWAHARMPLVPQWSAVGIITNSEDINVGATALSTLIRTKPDDLAPTLIVLLYGSAVHLVYVA